MPRDMFGDVVHRSIVLGTNRGYTLPVSIVTHATLIAVVIVAPLAATRLLPPPHRAFVIALPSPPLTPEPPPPVSSALPRVEPDIVPSRAPVAAANTIAPEPPPLMTVQLAATGLPSHPPSAFPTIAAPPSAAVPPVGPVRVGGDIKVPRKIRDVVPVYPPMARSARVQGSVIVEAIIGTDGRVSSSRVLRSIPLLDQAALDAVREWQYTSPTLNGAPIEVVMTATVTFALEATR